MGIHSRSISGKSKERCKHTGQVWDVSYEVYTIGVGKTCGFWYWYNPSTGETMTYRCNSYTCSKCLPRVVRRVRAKFSELIGSQGLEVFWTLTLVEGTPDKELMKAWNKLLTYMRKIYGDIKYIWVKERQKNGTLHLHFVVDIFLKYGTIKELWQKYTGAYQVKFKERKDLTIEQIKNYISKYISKNAVAKVKCVNRRARLWGRSLGMKTRGELKAMWKRLFKDMMNVESEWELMCEGHAEPSGDYKDCLYVLCPVYERIVE